MSATQDKISVDDLRNTLQSFQDDLQGKVEDRKKNLIAVGGGIAAVLLVLFFLLGKRSGKKQTTLVEIRRI